MATEDIEVKEPWDVVRTMHELDKLELHVKYFMSHTMQTMSTPRQDMWGRIYSDEVEHPMGNFLAAINSCKEGCYRQYGETQFKEGRQMTFEFKDALEELDG
jgi:hypothetical protein